MLVVLSPLILALVGGGWALRGAVSVWRDGERAAAGVIAAATLTGVLILIGFLLAGALGLHSIFKGG